jgi:pyridoxamine 5'-phosphate oxidase-like protein
VRETPEDLTELQRLLDESYDAAGHHLRSIFVPGRRSSAPDVVATLTGAFVINLATVTARAEPLVAPVDGLFYRGRLWFSLPPGAQRARHLLARPQASATYVDGETCLIVHGTAVEVREGHPFFAGFDEYARQVYGIEVDLVKERMSARTDPDFTGFIEPRRIYAQAFARTGD